MDNYNDLFLQSDTPSRTKLPGDRFIPDRASMNIELGHFILLQNQNEDVNPVPTKSPSTQTYKDHLSNLLFGESLEGIKILSPKEKAPATFPGHHQFLYTQHLPPSLKNHTRRQIPTTAEKILLAPGLLDDFYLNLLDWSRDNILSVGLGGDLFLLNHSSGQVSQLAKFVDVISSVCWCPVVPQCLAVGTSDYQVQLWDVEKQIPLRSLPGHSGRVCGLSWNNNILSTGSFDSNIHNHDVRTADHHVSTFSGHRGEVCTLKWSPDGTQLVSGSNDNHANIWRMDSPSPYCSLTEHHACVKALAWSPWQSNLLASGGGTTDRTIKFWNTTTGTCLHSVDTESQVCAIQWSKHTKELISSHGFAKNQLIVWKYPSMEKVGELTGHQQRVLHLVQSYDGLTLTSGSPDETLRFWRIFESLVTTLGMKRNHGNFFCGSRGIGSTIHKIR